MQQAWALVALLLPLTSLLQPAQGQLSSAITHNGHINVEGNKFLQADAHMDKKQVKDKYDDEEALPFDTCPVNNELKWSTEVSSSVYATPLITDLYSDGRKDIVVPAFVHYLEVLEADSGAVSVGWPAFHRSTTHASPLLFDMDMDGVQDIMLTTYNGEIMFFKDTNLANAKVAYKAHGNLTWVRLQGERLHMGLTIPRLRVKKYWFKDLEPPGPADTSKSTAQSPPQPSQQQQQQQQAVGGGAGGGAGHPGAAITEQVAEQLKEYRRRMLDFRTRYGDAAVRQLLEETKARNPAFHVLLMEQLGVEGVVDKEGNVHFPDAAVGIPPQQANTAHRRLMQVGVESGPAGGLSKEAADSFDVFKDDDVDGVDGNNDGNDGDQADIDTGDVDNDFQQGGDLGNDQQQAATDKAGTNRNTDTGFFDDEYHGVIDDVYKNIVDKGLINKQGDYDEFGDKVAADNVLPDDQDALDQQQLEENQRQEMEDMLSGIDTTSMDAAAGIQNDYHHLYFGDYEALAAARDKVLRKWWQSEDFAQESHQADLQYVYVDAHVLTTPAIGDIDGDGHEELVVAVSYYYDKEYYDHPDHRHEIGEALDLGKYIANGIVAFDLRTRLLKWSQHLDLSTDSTDLKAHAYATPTLIDLDRDGRLEVIVGTSMGYLYVLDSKGQPVKGWPIQMGEIQGQALVLDLNNDGHPEILAADTRGNIAVFKPNGEEVWSRHVGSMISHAATAGDVDGDGEIEVVVGTSSGHVYVLAGNTGMDTPGFPFRTHGRIHAPALITRLVDGPAQHIIVPAFDGYVYMINGATACADTIDVGEISYSMVLADDLDGNGRLDLLVTTMNGNVHAFETAAEYHPLKAWTAQEGAGANGMVARHDLLGIYATKESRRARDVAGDKLHLRVRVIDKRAVFAANGSLVTGQSGPYNISAVLRGVGVKEMAAGSTPVIGVADTVPGPGLYTLEVPCPRTRSSATLHLEMIDATGLTLVDEFALSFHMHFHKLLKWLIAGPLLLMTVGLFAVTNRQSSNDEDDMRLPVHSREQGNTHQQ